jgi:hypothetical protein
VKTHFVVIPQSRLLRLRDLLLRNGKDPEFSGQKRGEFGRDVELLASNQADAA